MLVASEAPGAGLPAAGELLALARVAAGLALSTWVGERLVGLLCGAAGGWSRVSRIALGYGVGLILVTIVLLLLALARVPWSVPSVAGALGAIGLVLRMLVRARLVGAAVTAEPGSSSIATPGNAARRRGGDPRHALTGCVRALRFVMCVLLAALVLGVAGLSLVNGADFVDAHAVWMLRGKAFFLDGGFDGTCFQRWIDAHDRRGYPPLVSLSVTFAHLCAGRADDVAAKLVFIGFHAALLGLFFGGVRRWVGRTTALGGTLLLASVPAGIALTIWGTADLPLAFFVCAGGLALARCVHEPGDRGAVGLAALASAGAALTKNEGLVLGVGLLCALVAGSRASGVRGRLRVRAGVGLVVSAVLALIPWWIVLWRHDIAVVVTPPGAAHAGALSGRLALVAEWGARCLIDPGWLFVWPLLGVVAVLLVRGGRARERSAAAAVGPSQLAGLGLACCCVVALHVGAQVFVFVSFTGDLSQLLQTTMGRLPFQVLPLALLTVLAVLCSRPDTRAEDPTTR